MKIKPHIFISGHEYVLPWVNTETDATIIAEVIKRVREVSE